VKPLEGLAYHKPYSHEWLENESELHVPQLFKRASHSGEKPICSRLSAPEFSTDETKSCQGRPRSPARDEMLLGGKSNPEIGIVHGNFHSTWTVREAALAARAASSRFALAGRIAE